MDLGNGEAAVRRPVSLASRQTVLHNMQVRASLSDQFRAAIRECGHSRSEICEAIGIDATVLSRFLNGHCGLSLDTLDRLGRFLNLRIMIGKSRRKSKR